MHGMTTLIASERTFTHGQQTDVRAVSNSQSRYTGSVNVSALVLTRASFAPSAIAFA
jgi:hypothetical protein